MVSYINQNRLLLLHISSTPASHIAFCTFTTLSPANHTSWASLTPVSSLILYSRLPLRVIGLGSTIKNALTDRSDSTHSSSNDVAPMNKGHRHTASTDSGYTSNGATDSSSDPTGKIIARDTVAPGATNATTTATTAHTGGTAHTAPRGRDAEAARAGVGAAAGDRDNDHGANMATSGVGRQLRDNVGGTGPTGSGRATADGYEPVTHSGGQRSGG